MPRNSSGSKNPRRPVQPPPNEQVCQPLGGLGRLEIKRRQRAQDDRKAGVVRLPGGAIVRVPLGDTDQEASTVTHSSGDGSSAGSSTSRSSLPDDIPPKARSFSFWCCGCGVAGDGVKAEVKAATLACTMGRAKSATVDAGSSSVDTKDKKRRLEAKSEEPNEDNSEVKSETRARITRAPGHFGANTEFEVPPKTIACVNPEEQRKLRLALVRQTWAAACQASEDGSEGARRYMECMRKMHPTLFGGLDQNLLAVLCQEGEVEQPSLSHSG